MSTQFVDKPTKVVLCDYCNREIDTEDQEKWAHIIREYLSRQTGTARYLRFVWHRPALHKVIEYDFHAACFDRMMHKLKGESL
jgi:hypothetical protein